jgi:hypothetical protein
MLSSKAEKAPHRDEWAMSFSSPKRKQGQHLLALRARVRKPAESLNTVRPRTSCKTPRAARLPE